MSGENYIDSKDWFMYLEREHEFILFDIFWRLYRKPLKKVTGYGLTKFLTYFKEGNGSWYRSKKEMKFLNQHLRTIIESKSDIIEKWIKREKKVWKIKINLKNEVTLILDQIDEILFYNTVLPMRLLAAISKLKGHENLKNQLEKIRSHSRYPIVLKEVIKPLLLKASNKLNISYDIASMLTKEELIKVLEKNYKPDVRILKKRMKGCYFFPQKNNLTFVFKSKDGLLKIDKGQKFLKGEVACKGKVTGVVNIINTIEQISKFEKDNILVSINTNPSLIEAIQKASAIVTDEGGITCHAAIIARELKIPCIIGTKYATKVFKDGDKVLVDATRGIVKKIK